MYCLEIILAFGGDDGKVNVYLEQSDQVLYLFSLSLSLCLVLFHFLVYKSHAINWP